MGILQALPNWIAPTTPRSTYLVNQTRGWLWFVFGVYGFVAHVLTFGYDVADSIPVLFFLSVYALSGNNFGKAQMARVEMNR